MISKMNFVSITGPKNHIDRIVDEHLSRYEMHLEYAPAELKSVENLHPFTEQNAYKTQIVHMEELSEHMGKPEYMDVNMDIEAAIDFIENP